MTLVNNLGRIQLIQGSPPALPGKCVVCGATNCPEGFVDVGWEIDFYGVVYFCAHCLREALAVVGFLPVDAFKELTRRLQEQRDKCEVLQIENEELRRGLDTLSSLGRFSVLDDSVGPDSVTIHESDEEPDEESAESDPEPTGGETRPPKQTNEQRPSSVHNDDSIQQIFDL